MSIRTSGLIREYKKREGTVKALDGVNIEVLNGEIFGLLGPNGAGKTTLIKILTTLLYPSAGEAYVRGLNVVKDSEKVRRIINLVSGGEMPGYGSLTVNENLKFFSKLYGLPGGEAEERITELFELMELGQYQNTHVNKLSSGFRQRLNLARGFLNRPEVLFLDEPTVGLDVLSARKLRAFIKGWVQEDPNRTVFLTTHYMLEADELCNRLAILDEGKIIKCDTPASLKRAVAGMVSFKVELAVDSESRSLDWKTLNPGIIGASYSDDIATGVGSVKLLLKSEKYGNEIVDQLKRMGLKLLSFTKLEPSLEDVYVELVGKAFE